MGGPAGDRGLEGEREKERKMNPGSPATRTKESMGGWRSGGGPDDDSYNSARAKLI